MAAMPQPPKPLGHRIAHCRIDSFRVLRQSFCGKFEFYADFSIQFLECMNASDSELFRIVFVFLVILGLSGILGIFGNLSKYFRIFSSAHQGSLSPVSVLSDFVEHF